MAFRVHGLRVESRNLTVYAQGTVGDIEVTENPADCGAPPAPGCCGPTYDNNLIIVAQGPLELFYSQVTLDWTLDWDGERQSWAGSVTDGSVEIGAELWCEEDPELGTVWWLSGTYINANGDSIPYFVAGTDYGDVLAFEVEISGTDSLLTLVVAHPCPATSGSGGGGEMVATDCCLVSSLLYLHTSAGQTFPLTWNGLSGSLALWSSGTVSVTGCGTSTFDFSCTGVGVSGFLLSGTGAGVDCAWGMNALSEAGACTPFSYTIDGTQSPSSAGCPCTTTLTFTVDENP